jgi:uncharacterized protein YbjT (DUF2867 family)
VEGTQRLIEAARRAGVQRLIVPSRLNADANSIHPLLRAKGEVERLVSRSGIPYTIVRTTSLFGRDDRFSEIILSLAIWSWPVVWLPAGGKTPTQPLWVEDYAYCLLKTLERPDLVNRTITVAGAERLSYREVMRAILNVTGRQRILVAAAAQADAAVGVAVAQLVALAAGGALLHGSLLRAGGD